MRWILSLIAGAVGSFLYGLACVIADLADLLRGR